MCVIIGLPKGVMVPWLSLKNAALNNADGFGIVVDGGGKLETIKRVNPKGNDPEEVQKLLEQFKDHPRYLHLRYTTAGATNEDNAHPFTVYKHNDHHIEFMHNGTISDYRPGTGDTRSDTHRFAAEFLSPLFERLKDNFDVEDPFLSSLIEARMSSMSRGLLISSKQGPSFLGRWKSIKDDNGDDIPVSNDDYFSDVKSYRRSTYEPNKSSYHTGGHGHGGGGVSQLPLQNHGKGAPANDASTPSGVKKVADIATLPIGGTNRESRMIDPKDFEDYMETGEDSLSDEAITYFSWVSTHELTRFATEKPETFALLFESVVARFSELVESYNDSVEETIKAQTKHEKATNLISSLQFELQQVRSLLGDVVEEKKEVAKVA